MKKIIAILLCIASVFCIAACGSEQTTSSNNKTLQTGTSGGASAMYPYRTFEEAFEFVDTVVKAKIKESYKFSKRYDKFVFEVTEVVSGVAGDTIEVFASDMKGNFFANGHSVNFYENGVIFNEGEEYLLLLGMNYDVYCKINPMYFLRFATAINLDNLPESKMYSEPLALHAKGIDVNTCTKEEMVDYVIKLVGDNKPKLIPSAETVEEITKEAYDLVHIKVKSLSSDGNSVLSDEAIKDTVIMYCEVIESLKGKEEEYEKVVEIVFFDDTVKSGEEYIVALAAFEKGTAYLTFLNANSLRPVSEKAEIKSYID